MKILFVDDDYEVELLFGILQTRFPQHEFELCWDLGSAISRVTNASFDRIVLDIMMRADPDLLPDSTEEYGLISGIHLSRFIKKSPSSKSKNAQIIFLTGVQTEEHEEIQRTSEKMRKGFLTKPVSTEKIISVLNIQ